VVWANTVNFDAKHDAHREASQTGVHHRVSARGLAAAIAAAHTLLTTLPPLKSSLFKSRLRGFTCVVVSMEHVAPQPSHHRDGRATQLTLLMRNENAQRRRSRARSGSG
jgi:hypothetical protein